MSFGARALIRLDALSHNLSVIKDFAPDAAVMAVVKANAYGHGLSVVARALTEADSFAVARLSEAIELRVAGIKQAIVLLSGVYSGQDLQEACDAGCELVVHNDCQVELLESFKGSQVTVWLKIDTGMNRLGFRVSQAAALIRRLRRLTCVRELRLMTHLANADNRNDATTNSQLALFERIASDFAGEISIANSGGIFGWPESIRPHYLPSSSRVWVRPGIALYGVSPFPEVNGHDLGLRPVMKFESRLVAVKPIRKGERVGYGGLWQAQCDSVLGIVSAGYGDGYTRYLPSGTPVLINGRTVPLAGAVSMDTAAVDLGSDSADKVGDPVILWGEGNPVEEIARQVGSMAYQLVCGVMHREDSGVVD